MENDILNQTEEQETVEVITTEEVKLENDKLDYKNNPFIKDVVKRSIYLLLGFFFFLFSFFPIIEIDVPEIPFEIKCDVNAYQTIQLFTDSLVNKSEEELLKDDVYIEMMTLSQKAQDLIYNSGSSSLNLGKLLDELETIVDDYFYYSLRSTLRSEEVSPTLSLIVSTITSIVFIVFSISFFIASAIYFGLLFVKNKNDKVEQIEGNLSKSLLKCTLRAPFIPIVAYFGIFTLILQSGLGGIAGTLKFLIIYSIISVALLFIYRYMFENKRFDKMVCLKNGVRVILGSILMFLLFVPVINVKTTDFSDDYPMTAKIPFKIAFLCNFESSVDAEDLSITGTREECLGLVEDSLESIFNEYGISQIEKGLANTYIIISMGAITFAELNGSGMILYSLPAICYLIVLILLSFYLYKVIKAILEEDGEVEKYQKYALCQFVLVLAAFVGILIFNSKFNNLFEIYTLDLDQTLKLSITGGLVVTLLLSLGLTVLPYGIKYMEDKLSNKQ